MDQAPKRPWHQLHWLTWLVLIVLVCTLVEREMRKAFGFPVSSLSFVTGTPFGATKNWMLVETGSAFNYLTLLLDLLFCLSLIAATAHVLELWLRSPNRLHFSLGSLLGLRGVAAILTGIVNGNVYDSVDWLGLPSLLLIGWDDLRHPLNWPLLLALACTIYSLGWLACFAVLRVRLLFRRSGT